MHEYTLDNLRDVNQNLRNAQMQVEDLTSQQTDILRALVKTGNYTQEDLAIVTGLTRGRIAQLAPRRRRHPEAVAA